MKMKKIPMPKKSGMDVMPMDMMPSFHVTTKQMPEIKNWKVGEKYKMVIEVRQKSAHQMEGHMEAGFEILAYSVEKDYDKMDDEEFEHEQAKALSNK